MAASGTRAMVWGKAHPVLSADSAGLNAIGRDYDGPRRPNFFWRKCSVVTCVVFGIVFLVSGVMEQRIVDKLINDQVLDQFRLDDQTSRFFKAWSDPNSNGFPLYFRVAVWDLQNKVDFLAGAKPNLKLVGPFTFVEKRVKHSFVYSDDSSIVWYKENASYVPVDTICPDGTDPTNFSVTCTMPINTTVTTVNIPLVTTLQLLRPLGPVEEGVIDYLNRSIVDPSLETLLIEKNITDVVFGYFDQFLALVDAKLNASEAFHDLITPNFALVANNSVPDATNWSAVKTRSSEGNLAEYVAWQGYNESVPYWNGCSELDNVGRLYNLEASYLKGTEAIVFQPGITKETQLDVFVGDLGRSGHLVYNNSRTINGVTAYRFVLSPDDFANVKGVSGNCAYSNFGLRGTLNMTSLVRAPAFASKPFWLDGDPEYLSNLTNVTPGPRGVTREEFDTFIDLEPYTGTTLQAQKQLQLSVQVGPSPYVETAGKLPYAYFPVCIISEKAIVPNNVTDELAATVSFVVDAGGIYYYVGIVLGSLLLVAALASGFHVHREMNSLDDADVEGLRQPDPATSPLLRSNAPAPLPPSGGFLPGAGATMTRH
mmetsp:Transcript_21130/g.62936  ORF Transcript_21130/g.62936 Transcript_21130/m.62936 type:complete len:597 (-) Transcript_21130:1730-3520(-)